MPRNCGECLMNDVEVVALDPRTGVCPRCGTDYGPEQPPPQEHDDDGATDEGPEDDRRD